MHINLKVILKNAEKNYRIALSLKPDFSETYNNLGNLLMENQELGRQKKPQTCYKIEQLLL